MDETAAISAFGALANDARLGIVRALIKAGETGLSAGQIAQHIGAAPSRASFHLNALKTAGLVTDTRHARQITYCASYDTLGALADFLMRDCCQNDPRILACCGDAPITNA